MVLKARLDELFQERLVGRDHKRPVDAYVGTSAHSVKLANSIGRNAEPVRIVPDGFIHRNRDPRGVSHRRQGHLEVVNVNVKFWHYTRFCPLGRSGNSVGFCQNDLFERITQSFKRRLRRLRRLRGGNGRLLDGRFHRQRGRRLFDGRNSRRLLRGRLLWRLGRRFDRGPRHRRRRHWRCRSGRDRRPRRFHGGRLRLFRGFFRNRAFRFL